MKHSLIFAIAIVACSTPGLARTSLERLLAKQPAFRIDSFRSRDELEGCIAPKLSGLGIPSVIHGAGRSDIIYSKGALVISLLERAPGTAIEARYILPMKIRGKIESCLADPAFPTP
jgi:hypothetical protein